MSSLSPRPMEKSPATSGNHRTACSSSRRKAATTHAVRRGRLPESEERVARDDLFRIDMSLEMGGPGTYAPTNGSQATWPFRRRIPGGVHNFANRHRVVTSDERHELALDRGTA